MPLVADDDHLGQDALLFGRENVPMRVKPLRHLHATAVAAPGFQGVIGSQDEDVRANRARGHTQFPRQIPHGFPAARCQDPDDFQPALARRHCRSPPFPWLRPHGTAQIGSLFSYLKNFVPGFFDKKSRMTGNRTLPVSQSSGDLVSRCSVYMGLLIMSCVAAHGRPGACPLHGAVARYVARPKRTRGICASPPAAGRSIGWGALPRGFACGV